MDLIDYINTLSKEAALNFMTDLSAKLPACPQCRNAAPAPET